MKKVDTGKVELLLVKVPEDSNKFSIGEGENSSTLYFVYKSIGYYLPLPQGNYQLINTSNDITKDEAKELVPKVMSVFLNYINSVMCDTYDLYTALDSFNSLMEANELTDGNYAILKVLK